jgi:uncharacterized membrane protein
MGHLIVAADAPLIVRATADAVLFAHIGGGTVGMISGAVALATRKGGRIHRLSGNVFFGAMLVMAGIGAVVSPMLNDRVSTFAGVLTFYLVVTAWLAVKRPAGTLGRLEVAAAIVPLSAIVVGLILIRMAAVSPDGMVDGAPPQANYVFAILGSFALAGDIHMMLRRGLSGAARIARHLWRMCVSLVIAAGSFFLGQQQVLPKAMVGTPLQFAPVLIPLVLMVFWLGHTWWTRRRRGTPTMAAA